MRRLLLTQMTPTGRDTACQLYPDAEVRYLPYDYPGAVRDFLAVWQPRFGVLMETELWPNLLHAARQQGVPVFLANARLSEKSLRGYRRIQGLIGPALRDLTAIAAQSQQDAERLQQLALCSPQVCGNTKYDFTPPAAMAELAAQFRQRIGSRPVFICASTRDGEEQLILQAWQQAEVGNTLLLLVPRHPERFDSVAALARHGLCRATAQRQQQDCCRTSVWLGDSMGELFAYYGCADVAFVGGSLLPLGGQNLIEPASLGLPVLFGPSMFNFAQASELACRLALPGKWQMLLPWCSRCLACCRTTPAVSRCTALRWRLPQRIVVPASALSSYCRRICLPDTAALSWAAVACPPRRASHFLSCINHYRILLCHFYTHV
jgi:3-deoxy-D-manno-octulosonic-acid transferase